MTRKQQPVPATFEEAMKELEKILRDIEAGEVPLEESLVQYERGQFLIKHCREVLGKAEKHIETLTAAEDEDAELTGTPLPEDDG